MSKARKKFKLLCITDTYIGGRAGSERYLHNLCTSLDAGYYDITVVQLTTKSAIPVLSGGIKGKANITVERMPVSRIYGLDGLRTFLAIRKMLLLHDYDTVLSLHEKADLINALLPKKHGKPVKISSRRDMGFKKKQALRMLFRRINSRFDAIVAPSQAILDSLNEREAVAKKQLHLIRNGIDINRMRSLSVDEQEAVRQSLGIRPEQKVIGCVANFNPVKGHQYLLAAFRDVARQMPDAVLVLVGDGDERPSLENSIAKLGIENKVILLGIRDDVLQLLQVFDVAVSSSLSEGLSNALIEAAASGLPIVATNVGGNPEIVHDGTNGFLVPAMDSSALCSAITRILDDGVHATDMGRQARAIVETGFSLHQVIDEYHQLFTKNAHDVC